MAVETLNIDFFSNRQHVKKSTRSNSRSREQTRNRPTLLLLDRRSLLRGRFRRDLESFLGTPPIKIDEFMSTDLPRPAAGFDLFHVRKIDDFVGVDAGCLRKLIRHHL